jgi:hypothetical protein
MDVKKDIMCANLLPPPGNEVVKELGDLYLALEKRCEEAERERDELRDELETMRLRLAACGVAALTNTEESRRAQMIDISNPYYSASYQDVLNAVEREMKLRADNATLRKRLEPIEEWWDRNCSEYIRKKHQKWDASMYEAIEKAMELKEG